MTAKKKFRILLAEDHVLIRHGVKNILKEDSSLVVAGEVCDGNELIEFLESCQVDMVILDLSMPGLDGMKAISLVKDTYPRIKILILTMHKKRNYFYKAMAGGADGYLTKDDTDRELLVAVRKVLSGRNYVSPALADDFTEDVITASRPEKNGPFAELTRRESEVLKLVVQGYTSKKMATHFNLSQRTIDHHRSNLLRKFNRKNSVDLVNYVVSSSLFSD